jgi:hypothetical protein
MVLIDLLYGFTTEAFQSLGIALDNSAIAGGAADRTKQAWNEVAWDHISPLVAGLCVDAMPGLEGMREDVEGLPLYVEASDTETCVFSLLYIEVGNSARIAQVARHEREETGPDTIAKERALLDNAISRLNRPMRNLADTFRVGTHVTSIVEHLCSETPSWTGLAGVAKVATEDHIFSEANGSMAFQTTEKNGVINQHAVSSLSTEREKIAKAEAKLSTMKANVSKREAGARRAYYAQPEVAVLVPDNRKKSAKKTLSAVTQGEAISAILERGLTEEERATLDAQREALAVS